MKHISFILYIILITIVAVALNSISTILGTGFLLILMLALFLLTIKKKLNR